MNESLNGKVRTEIRVTVCGEWQWPVLQCPWLHLI